MSMKMLGGILSVLLLFSFVGFAAADEAQAMAGASASVIVTATAAPVKERVQALREDVKEKREAARERIQGAREAVKETQKQLREREKVLREENAQTREDAKERLRALKRERNDELQKARDKVKDLEGRLKALRIKSNLSVEEKAEFKVKILDNVQASFDQRIRAAKRLETEGVNATLVAEFVAFAEAQKGRVADATNNTLRKELVVEFNQKWRAFKQAAKDDLKKVRLREVIAKSAEALVKMDTTIARLENAGFNVTALEDASAKIKARLGLAANASTFEDSMVHLRAANRGLVYLKQAIRLTLRREKVAMLIDQIDAQISAQVGASVNASANVTA
ncbi:MAG TPA: hypothetical protein VI874_01375 [Candidatus Norongarragalinales archaeon]|nr:hypothetical protein [Candidatus Norongarragalinales archaeon]